MNRVFANIVCLFIPFKKLRKKVRAKLLANEIAIKKILAAQDELRESLLKIPSNTPPQPQKNYCPFCKRWVPFEIFGNEFRPNAACSSCGSLERHRFMFFLYRNEIADKLARGGKVLHIAPEKMIHDYLIKLGMNPKNYTGCDMYPDQAYFSWLPNIRKEDGMATSFPDKTFDVIIHNQVIEHVLDDVGFIRENLRILKDDGVIIINLPYDDTRKVGIYDDSVQTPKARFDVYLQGDHVRLYGCEFAERLAGKGYDIRRVREEDMFRMDQIEAMRLRRNVYLSDGYLIITKK
jgi:SAM-dependent methyltransferase